VFALKALVCRRNVSRVKTAEYKLGWYRGSITFAPYQGREFYFFIGGRI
jgi:hypothetical protein